MRIMAKKSQDTHVFTDVNTVEGLETTFLDITDLDAVRQIVKDNDINAIVNCAAWTNVDGAEDPEKYELVEKLNATAPENLAKVMKEVGGLLVHISTDYVFGAEPYNTPCKEDQTGIPTGVYGLTKLHGEQKITATGSLHKVYYLSYVALVYRIARQQKAALRQRATALMHTYCRHIGTCVHTCKRHSVGKIEMCAVCLVGKQIHSVFVGKVGNTLYIRAYAVIGGIIHKYRLGVGIFLYRLFYVLVSHTKRNTKFLIHTGVYVYRYCTA